MRRWSFILALMLSALLTAGLTGCGDSDGGDGGATGGTGTGGDAGGAATGGATTGGATMGGAAGGGTGTCDTSVASDDCDGDGIANAIENGSATDVNNPDTDGDGWCDGPNDVDGTCIGGEDLNANGMVDEGELNPTDPNDAPAVDSLVGMSVRVACGPELVTTVGQSPSASAGVALALPSSFTLNEEQAAGGARFSNSDGTVFGYVVSQTNASSDVRAANVTNLQGIARGGNRFITEFIGVPFTSSAERRRNESSSTANAIRVLLRYDYGMGTDNDGAATKSPGVLRDEILSAISGATVSSGDMGTACDSLVHRQVAELFDGRLITVGVVACRDAIDASADTDIFMTDIIDTSNYAPNLAGETFVPDGLSCEQQAAAQAGTVDFLWVIDNSGSMADEQQAVASTVNLFLTQLEQSSIDWRIGVVSSDAYCLEENMDGSAVEPACDALNSSVDTIDALVMSPESQCSGLRGQGFLPSSNTNAGTLFSEYVTQNSICDRTMFIPPSMQGDNICGFGLESGLRSALFSYDRLQSGSCNDPAYQLRAGADFVVVFVSDEEDQEFKADYSSGASPVLANDDATREMRSADYVARFNMRSITAFAIIGDEGAPTMDNPDRTGVCTELPPRIDAVDGAQHGLGYEAVANGTSGAVGSICNDDLSTTVTEIINAAIRSANNSPLDKEAISSSIRVAVNGELLAREPGPNNDRPFFRYDFVTDEMTGRTRPVISLFNLNNLTTPPTPGDDNPDDDTVVIGYKRWIPVGGG